jgi:hypothetical protein
VSSNRIRVPLDAYLEIRLQVDSVESVERGPIAKVHAIPVAVVLVHDGDELGRLLLEDRE